MCQICNGFTFAKPLVRLRTPSGGYVFLEWHNYLGPTFYMDREGRREMVAVCTDDALFQAFDWWHSRGKKG